MRENQFLPLKLNEQMESLFINLFAHLVELGVQKHLSSFPYLPDIKLVKLVSKFSLDVNKFDAKTKLRFDETS